MTRNGNPKLETGNSKQFQKHSKHEFTVAGMLNENSAKPARLIVEEMAESAARILKQLARDYADGLE